jgi:hypothetical protein
MMIQEWNRSMRQLLIPILLMIASGPPATAGVYGEHKLIGDMAFERCVAAVRADTSITDSCDAIIAELGLVRENDLYIWKSFSPLISISFGDLTALSADHVATPEELREQLKIARSSPNICAGLHHLSIKAGDLAAGDLALTALDTRYPMLAIANISHFYRYGRSFGEQLEEFDRGIVKALIDDHDVQRQFDRMVSSNCIAKYVILHCTARLVAFNAGSIWESDRAGSLKELERAFFYEAFAQHFLQDAFSAGHLPVRRTWIGSFTRDLSLHDLYGEIGLKVFNLRGDRWILYGDGRMNDMPGATATADTTRLSSTMEIAIEASTISVREVADAFGGGQLRFKAPELEGERLDRALSTYGALRLVPVPYYTPFSEIGSSVSAFDGLDYVPNRNEIGSRIGTSISIGESFTGGSSFWINLSMRGFGITRAYRRHLEGVPWGAATWYDLQLSYQNGAGKDLASQERWWQMMIGGEMHLGLGGPLSFGMNVGIRDVDTALVAVASPYIAVPIGAIASYLPLIVGAERWDDNPLYDLNIRMVATGDVTAATIGEPFLQRLRIGLEADIPRMLELIP